MDFRDPDLFWVMWDGGAGAFDRILTSAVIVGAWERWNQLSPFSLATNQESKAQFCHKNSMAKITHLGNIHANFLRQLSKVY